MPSSEAHRRSGRKAAIREYHKVSRLHEKEPGRVGEQVSAWLGEKCATNPDYYEPGTHGHHRGPRHSTARRRELRCELKQAEESGAGITAAQIKAELDHLQLDSKTPAGLPNIKKKKGFLNWLSSL